MDIAAARTPVAPERLHGQPRLLVIPGLHDSGPTHWQTWLQSQYRDAKRVVQDDWSDPRLDRWAERITGTLAGSRDDWVAVAHSFGCLALARHLLMEPLSPIRAALFVAPAEPEKFGVALQLPQRPLRIPSTMLTSDTDPWMSAESAHRWAERWGARCLDLGDAGHVNAESGHQRLLPARRWVDAQRRRITRENRAMGNEVPGWLLAM